MSILTEPKIDSHCHILDPVRFPYLDSVPYKPAGQETGNTQYFKEVMRCYEVKHALLVGPNSGYTTDNRCMLDAIASAPQKFKGIAVVPNDCSLEQLEVLKDQGVIGIAFNLALMGFDFYADIEPLLRRLKQLDVWAQFQVEKELLLDILPMLSTVGVKTMIDHCGRPNVDAGTGQHAFQALLALGRQGQAVVKISGFAKFSHSAFPFTDVRPYTELLARHFGVHHCVWASDWPYLKASYRLDYGPMLKIYEADFSPSERRAMLWDAPKKHFEFQDVP